MKTKLLSIILLVFLIVSCQDESSQDLTYRMITSSKLTVTVIDRNGTAISHVKIKLYDRAILSSSSSSSTYSSLQYINVATTDANGKVDFGEVATGTYFILIDSVRVNGLNYQPIMQFQMNSAVDKSITVNPEDYVTTFNFNFNKVDVSTANSTYSVGGFSNLNVLLIPVESYSAYSTLDKLISLAGVKGKTDATGNVSLKAPAFKYYVAVIYNDAKTAFARLNYTDYSSNTFSGDKDATSNYNYTLDSKTLSNNSYGIYNLSIKKIVPLPTSTSPIQVPFAGINLALIPYNTYDSNMPLSILLPTAESTGKTDSEGNISFLLKSGASYVLIAYNDSKTVYSTLSTSAYVNSGETRQTAYSLHPTTLTAVQYSNLYLTMSKTNSVYYTSNPTDLTPFSNLDVVLVPYLSSNSTASIDDLISKAVASGKTNEAGQIRFVLATPASYNYSYYQIVAYNAGKTAKFVSSSISMYSGNSYTQGYMLNSTTLATVN
ncbi:MAG: hypothetical protein QM800_14985 [Paludibacter sp.]